MTEAQIQAAFYKEAYNRFPQIRGLLFAVPNGGTRNIREAMTLQATGVMPGCPDMLLMAPLMAFEFKSDTGKLSPAQIRIHAIWKQAGIPVHLCRSAKEALQVLENVFAV